MKKYTNKILLITFLVILVICCVAVSIDFHRDYRLHPEYFRSQGEDTSIRQTIVVDHGDTVQISRDSAEEIDSTNHNN